MSTKFKILKYGLVGTASASAAAFLAGASSAQPGFKQDAGINAAKAAAITGAVVTGGFLGRKYIASGFKAAAKTVTKDVGAAVNKGTSKLGFVFRRIHGRVVKIKVK